jgi:hypothetical protein
MYNRNDLCKMSFDTPTMTCRLSLNGSTGNVAMTTGNNRVYVQPLNKAIIKHVDDDFNWEGTAEQGGSPVVNVAQGTLTVYHRSQHGWTEAGDASPWFNFGFSVERTFAAGQVFQQTITRPEPTRTRVDYRIGGTSADYETNWIDVRPVLKIGTVESSTAVDGDEISHDTLDGGNFLFVSHPDPEHELRVEGVFGGDLGERRPLRNRCWRQHHAGGG